MKFSIQDIFSELVQIGKALMENVIYCTVTYIKTRKTWSKKCKKKNALLYKKLHSSTYYTRT